jgi:hypothetical protein
LIVVRDRVGEEERSQAMRGGVCVQGLGRKGLYRLLRSLLALNGFSCLLSSKNLTLLQKLSCLCPPSPSV